MYFGSLYQSSFWILHFFLEINCFGPGIILAVKLCFVVSVMDVFQMGVTLIKNLRIILKRCHVRSEFMFFDGLRL